MTDQRADVLIVTALALERAAVRPHLDQVRIESLDGLYADLGTFDPGASPQRVAVVETGAGNVPAAVLTTLAEELLRPRLIVMVGVAGGVKDVVVGDVVASSKVYWIEGGKEKDTLAPRPDFAPVSVALVQLARAVSADGRWIERAAATGGGRWQDRAPGSLVAPIVTGEKVVAAQMGPTAELVRSVYSDAVAIDMEDFGTLRGGAATERAKVIAVRGISDLLAGKAEADAAGSQPIAAANAVAFVFEMLALMAPGQSGGPRAPFDLRLVAALGARLYPEGPQQEALWTRAGGDLARLNVGGTGFARWWDAATLLDRGGGGTTITIDTLLATMGSDYPENEDLIELIAARRQASH